MVLYIYRYMHAYLFLATIHGTKSDLRIYIDIILVHFLHQLLCSRAHPDLERLHLGMQFQWHVDA